MPSDTTNAEQLLRTERERLVRQLAELGAAETGDLNVDIDFGGSFADAAAVTAERTDAGLDPIVHTSVFLLVDARGDVRGVYDSERERWEVEPDLRDLEDERRPHR